jgi:hypothetical protein
MQTESKNKGGVVIPYHERLWSNLPVFIFREYEVWNKSCNPIKNLWNGHH